MRENIERLFGRITTQMIARDNWENYGVVLVAMAIIYLAQILYTTLTEIGYRLRYIGK